MAQGINLVQNPPKYSGRGIDTTRQVAPAQRAIVDTANPQGQGRTRWPYDDVTPGGHGAGTVGNGYKPFRVSGG